MTNPDITARLEQLEQGTQIRVKLEDGSEVTGKYGGTEDGQVHIEDGDDVALDQVETVLMDVGSAGPE